MINFVEEQLDLTKCQLSVQKFETFLAENSEIEETGANGLQTFFMENPQLLLLLSETFADAFSPRWYQSEVQIFHEFRADFVVANIDKTKFSFIEFEDAKSNSVFKEKSISKVTSYEWSPRFEHGYSQVVDWHFRIDDFRRTSKIEEYFGKPDIEFTGILVIGRDSSISNNGLKNRFQWRNDRTIVNSQNIICMTFDKLLSEIKGRLSVLNSLFSA